MNSNYMKLAHNIFEFSDMPSLKMKHAARFLKPVQDHRIREPMRDILFDEEIAGSFHLTPGQAYEEADNGNRSQVHWDLVGIQRPDYGGGEIYFDGKLIRKDGLFLPRPLQKLNPEYLLKSSSGNGQLKENQCLIN